MNKIESLKCDRDEDYFDGSFKHICSRIYLFEYKVTNRASDAVRDDFQLAICDVDELAIFPSCGSLLPDIVSIDVKIFCVSETTLNIIKEH